MKKAKKLFLWMLVGAVSLGLGANMVFAKGGPGMGGPMGPGGGKGMGMGICNPYNQSLSPEQRQKLLELREAYLKEITPIQNQLMTKKLELRNLWRSQNPDQDKILEKQKEINALHAQIQEKAIKYRLDCDKVVSSAASTQ